MTPDLAESLEQALRANSIIQLTGGTREDRRTLLHTELPSPVIEANGKNIEDSDTLADNLLSQTDGDEDAYEPWWEVEGFLEAHEGTLILTNFDAIDRSTAVTVAQKLKGLYETTPAALAVTAADPGALLLANGDLTGRVRTIDLDDVEG